MHQIKKMAQRGLLDPEKEDPFALFVASTSIRCVSVWGPHLGCEACSLCRWGIALQHLANAACCHSQDRPNPPT